MPDTNDILCRHTGHEVMSIVPEDRRHRVRGDVQEFGAVAIGCLPDSHPIGGMDISGHP